MTAETPTIVLIHGLWMTPSSWDPFRRFYEDRGHTVLAPPWPRLGSTVDEIRRDPSPLDGLGVTEIVDHYDAIIRTLDEPPVVMGHCFGGLFVQMLLDRGLGAAGVAIGPAAPKGVPGLRWSAARSLWPVLRNPANRKRTVALTFEQFRYAFANAMSDRDARAAYEREAIPGPGRPVFQVGLAALAPHAATKVSFGKGTRAPLLFIAGGDNHIAPPSINRANDRKYWRSPAVTSFMEFPGRSHLIVAQAGWEEVADNALLWALCHATSRAAIEAESAVAA